MIVNDLYVSWALVNCYEGDETLNEETSNEDEVKAPEGFTPEQQKKFNEAMAAERRKSEAKYKTQLTKQESMYKELLQNKNLTEQQRTGLEEQLAVVSGQLRTEKNIAAEKMKELESAYQERLTEAQKRAEAAEFKYRDSTIQRALQDAAVVNDAFRPEQIVTLLKNMTKLVDDKVVVELPDEDATTGETILTTRTADEAVKRMREKADVYGNLFKSNVVSGIGSSSATGGVTPGANGKVDVRKLTPQQYRDLRAKNPELLGLGPKRGR